MTTTTPTNVRKGRFLWMEADEKSKYLSELQAKIALGHFCSDQVLSKIVDELAPVFCESADSDMI